MSRPPTETFLPEWTFSHWTTSSEAAYVPVKAGSRVADVRSQLHPEAHDLRAQEFEDQENEHFGFDPPGYD
jgi:hypothetical protein